MIKNSIKRKIEMLKKLMIILLVMLMIIGIGVFWICHNFLPEKEERIAYDKEKKNSAN